MQTGGEGLSVLWRACDLMNAPVISKESWKQAEFSRSDLKYYKYDIYGLLFDFCVSGGGTMRKDDPQLEHLTWGSGNLAQLLRAWYSVLCVCVLRKALICW